MSFLRKLCFIACVSKVLGGDGGTNSPKIFGGNDVSSAQTYPYQVSIQMLNGFHFCGGSIIDTAWVLTAAHCQVDVLQSKIVAGTVVDSEGGVTKMVLSVKTHQDYDTKNLRNDIALVRVVGRFDYTDTVQPITLASEIPSSDAMATLTGWGDQSNGAATNRLQVLSVQIMQMSSCQRYYYGVVPVTSEYHVCTVNTIGEGACLGDSGSALQLNNEQIGIVSFGRRPCGNGYPVVYTNVPNYKNWISETVGREF